MLNTNKNKKNQPPSGEGMKPQYKNYSGSVIPSAPLKERAVQKQPFSPNIVKKNPHTRAARR